MKSDLMQKQYGPTGGDPGESGKKGSQVVFFKIKQEGTNLWRLSLNEKAFGGREKWRGHS